MCQKQTTTLLNLEHMLLRVSSISIDLVNPAIHSGGIREPHPSSPQSGEEILTSQKLVNTGVDLALSGHNPEDGEQVLHAMPTDQSIHTIWDRPWDGVER